MGIVITGAASGIGRAVARGLLSVIAADGPTQLLLVDRDADALESVTREIGSSAVSLVMDVGESDCGERIATTARKKLGRVTGLVSNAGFISAGGLADISVELFDTSFAVNTRAAWLIARALRPLMLEAGGGSIVATASLSASHPTPPLGAYAASKAALVMLMRQLASEWGPEGIRCNTVSPGATLTAMTAAGYADEQRRAAREAAIPTRRINTAEDVANAILFLLSDAARQINGIDLLVDGGISTTLMAATGSGSGQGRK